MTDDGLKELAPLTGIRILVLPRGVSDAGLKQLAPFQKLEVLALNGIDITDAGLREIAAQDLTSLVYPSRK